MRWLTIFLSIKDGNHDENSWKTAEPAGRFQRVTPTDTCYAIAQTEGLQYDGTKVLYSWDIKWRSAEKSYDDRRVIEFGIPLCALCVLCG
jgi:hypothetical protein